MLCLVRTHANAARWIFGKKIALKREIVGITGIDFLHSLIYSRLKVVLMYVLTRTTRSHVIGSPP